MFSQPLKSKTNPSNKMLSIGPYTYTEANKLGEGYESVVYRATNSTARNAKEREVALKIIDMSKIQQGVNKTLLTSELKCLKLLRGTPFILNILEIIKTTQFTYVVTELCKCDLGSRKHKKLPEREAWNYIRQMIQGYKHLYLKGIVHRDLKPENLFVIQPGHIKIGDFGFAAPLEEARRQSNYNIGSPSYMAPQVLSRNHYSHSADIWSIGVSFYELLTGSVPWVCKSQSQIQQLITPVSIMEKINDLKIGEGCKYFLRKTMEFEYLERMKPEELFEYDPFVQHLKVAKSSEHCAAHDKKSSLSTSAGDSPDQQKQREVPTSARGPLKTKLNFGLALEDVKKQRPSTHKLQKKPSMTPASPNPPKHQQPQLKTHPDKITSGQKIIPTTAKKNGRNGHDHPDAAYDHLDEELIEKAINGYIECCSFIAKFLESAAHLDPRIQTQFTVLRICLKNFVIKTMDKIGDLEHSDLLADVCQAHKLNKYLKNHPSTTNQNHKAALALLLATDEFKTHWPLAKDQKPRAVLNAAYSLLTKLKGVIQCDKRLSLLVVAEFSCKIAQIFTHLTKHKYLTSDTMQTVTRIRRKPLSAEGVLTKITQLQKLP